MYWMEYSIMVNVLDGIFYNGNVLDGIFYNGKCIGWNIL